jgi:hypothetical protein
VYSNGLGTFGASVSSAVTVPVIVVSKPRPLFVLFAGPVVGLQAVITPATAIMNFDYTAKQHTTRQHGDVRAPVINNSNDLLVLPQ